MLVRRKQNWWRDPSIITTIVTNIFLAIFTGGLVWVGIQQSRILDQTDETLREGERANVYIMDFIPQLIDKNWWFTIWANNSGTTRARPSLIILVAKNLARQEKLVSTQLSLTLSRKLVSDRAAGPMIKLFLIGKQELYHIFTGIYFTRMRLLSITSRDTVANL